MKLTYIALAGLPSLCPIAVQASEATIPNSPTSSCSKCEGGEITHDKLVEKQVLTVIASHLVKMNKGREDWKPEPILPHHHLDRDLGIDSLDVMNLACRIEKEMKLSNFELPTRRTMFRLLAKSGTPIEGSGHSQKPLPTIHPVSTVKEVIEHVSKAVKEKQKKLAVASTEKKQ